MTDKKTEDKPDTGRAVAEAMDAYRDQAPRFTIEVGRYGPPTHGAKISLSITGGDPDAMEAFGLELTKLVADRIPNLRRKR